MWENESACKEKGFNSWSKGERHPQKLVAWFARHLVSITIIAELKVLKMCYDNGIQIQATQERALQTFQMYQPVVRRKEGIFLSLAWTSSKP